MSSPQSPRHWKPARPLGRKTVQANEREYQKWRPKRRLAISTGFLRVIVLQPLPD
jgi:hypothetical protein